MADDEDRAAIVARRNKFVAMALAGLTSAAVGCGDDGYVPGFSPCLEAPPMMPQACLDVADEDPSTEMGPLMPDMAPAEPSVCLSVAPPEPEQEPEPPPPGDDGDDA